MKLAWRTSSTWRSSRPSTLFGSRFRNASKSSASNFFVGMNCQTIGPSLAPSCEIPLSMKRSIESLPSASNLRFVAKREALTENMKSGGVSSRHLAKLLAFCVPW